MRIVLAPLVALALAGVAHGQLAPAGGFSLQTFRPALDGKGYVTVDGSALLGHLDFSIGLVSSYAHDVLTLTRANSPNTLTVEHLLTPQLQGALGLWNRLEVGVSLPVHVMFGARAPGFRDPGGDRNLDDDLHFAAQSFGDLGVHVKTRILDGWKHALGLGAALSLYVPTGNDKQLLGEGQVTLRPELIVDKEFGRTRRFKLALNLGALVRPARHSFTDGGVTLSARDVGGGAPFCQPAAPLASAPATAAAAMATLPPPGDPACGTQATRALGTQLAYGLGLSYAVVPQRLELIGEAFGYADVTGAAAGHPLEGLLAAKVYLAARSFFELGGGAGLLPRSVAGGMTGAPGFRVFVGFIFEPSIGDRDGDGIKDDVDQCPDDPEDFDGFEDEDGCPDPDNDRDGVLDVDDRCPDVPGPVENHGCPFADRDHHGILDKDDACPDVPGPVENHGCPFADRDHDGVLDEDDLCPDEPGPVENHGCPPRDSDGDGLLDQDDECPRVPGPKENGGCPLKATTRLRGGELVIMKPVFFETDKAIIKPVSYAILDAVADTLRTNPQLLLVEIQGHADERGDDDHNLRLTQDRAAAVKAYLVDKGVAGDRLVARGYGETRPLCKQHGEGCWSQNRRVQFIILRHEGSPLP
jgi:OOP family OmpA-OmpF porin